MPLVQETDAGFRFLKKTVTQADYGAIVASHMFDKQLGSDGDGNLVFTLPKDYAVASNTLLVFINGQKAERKDSPTLPNEYREANSRTVVFGSALASTDVVEFLVAGTYSTEGSAGGGSGSLNAVLVSDDTTIAALDRAVCIAAKAITVNLPLNPIAGEICEVVDALGQASTYNITVNRNTSNIQGLAENIIIDTDGEAVFFLYVDETYGWKFTLTGNNYEQVSGFRQYHSATADEGQTIFNLPFTIDAVTKNVSIHADGLMMTQDAAYTITDTTQITFTEGFLGGELVEFESFLASSLGKLYSLEEAHLFKQTYTETATAAQTEVTIPFDVDLARKNLTVYVDGVRQYTDEAFTVDASTLLTFTEAFVGGEKILVESFNTGSLDDLVFNSYQYETTAIQDQTSISLPFTYEVGAKNLALTINGVRQSPSKFTEIDESTIEVVSPLDEGDEILVESVLMGAFGVIPLAQDSNMFGGVAPSGYTSIITEDLDLYISPSGNDADSGDIDNPWQTAQHALEWLNDKWISSNCIIRVNFLDGIHSFSDTLSVTHPCGQRITFQGLNYVQTTMTSVVSSSGSSGAYSIVISVADASDIQVGNYALIRGSSIEDPSAPNANFANPEFIMGAHEITAVDSANNQITIASINSAVPSGTVTATVHIVKAIVNCTLGAFSVVTYVNIKQLVFIGVGKTSIAIVASNGGNAVCDTIATLNFNHSFHSVRNSSVYCTTCIASDCNNGITSYYGSNIVAYYCGFINIGTVGISGAYACSVICNELFVIDCVLEAVSCASGSGGYVANMRAINCGYGVRSIFGSSFYCHLSSIIACTYGADSEMDAHITIYSCNLENCTGFAYKATIAASIYGHSNTLYGNASDYTPANGVTGNNNSIIVMS